MTRAVTVDRTNRELLVDGSSSEMLRELLSELDDVLARVGLPRDLILQTGLDEQVVRGLCETSGYDPPEELVVWYGWQNGRKPGRSYTPLPFIDPLPLEEALASYRNLALDDVLAREVPTFWAPGWLFLELPNVGLAMGPADSPRGPQLRITDFDEQLGWPPKGPVARSLCTLVTLFLEAFDRGGYTFENNRWVAHWDRLTPLQQLSRFLTVAPM